MNLLMLYGNQAAHYDDYRLFTQLGFKVASPFALDCQPWPMHRPATQKHFSFLDDIIGGCPDRDMWGEPQRLPPEFFEPFDVVVVLLVTMWIRNYWESMNNGKRLIIWRSGEGGPGKEMNIRQYRPKLKVVRSSPTELMLPNNVGADAVIRWASDPDEWCGWQGNVDRVVTISRSVKRTDCRNWDEISHLSADHPWVVYGAGNEDCHLSGGFLDYEQLRAAYRDNRVYFDGNARPAPWTLAFKEAWTTGIPVVAVGPERGNKEGLQTYEVPRLIEHGLNGICSDDLDELSQYIQALRNDHDYARTVGELGRRKALEIFGWEKIKEQWRRFFEEQL